MERKHPLVIDRSAETGGDTREAAFNKVDKELDNIIGSANSIKEELGALAAEVEAMEPVDTSSFAKKTEIPKIVSGSGIRVVVTGQENKISADIPIASGIESGLMSSADKISLDGLKAQEPIFEGHLADPDKHLPEILAADTGKILEATSTGAKWTTPATGGGVTSLNGKSGALSMSGTGVASVTTGSNYITVNVPAPNFPVKSVNSKYGDIILGANDVGAAPTIHTHDFPVTSVNGQTGDVIISAGGGGEPGGFKFWESGEYPIFWDAFTTVDLDFEIEHPERCMCTAQVKYIGPDGKITYWNQGDIALSAISNVGTTFPLEPLIGSKTIKLWSGNNGLRLHHPRNSGYISLVSTAGSVFHFDNFRYLFKLWYV